MKIYIKIILKHHYNGKNAANITKINYSKDKSLRSEIYISKFNLMQRNINNFDFIFAQN